MHSPALGLDYHYLATFAAATFVETITPGPTLALIVETRAAKDRRAAIEAVFGVALANISWIFVILWLNDKVPSPATAPLFFALLRDCGAAYLIYLSTRRLLSSGLRVLSRVDRRDPSPRHRGSILLTGFMAHAFNPVTPPYYLLVFALAVLGRPVEVGLAFGAAPVLFDFAVYAALALVPLPETDLGPRVGAIPRLLAGGLFLYLVAHAFSQGAPSSGQLMLPGLTALLMLVGFLWGAIDEAYAWVKSRTGEDNKLLWRVVALWGSWFSVTALLGGLYTLIEGIDHGAIALDTALSARIRICFVVAAVMAASLSCAKAFGEIQDEQGNAPKQGTGIRPGWIGHPLKAGAGVLALLIAVLVLLAITGLQVH